MKEVTSPTDKVLQRPDEDDERARLLAQSAELANKIKQKTLLLLEHAGVPPSFKNHPLIKQVVK